MPYEDAGNRTASNHRHVYAGHWEQKDAEDGFLCAWVRANRNMFAATAVR